MYSRKAIETAIHFSAGETTCWSLNGLQFRADGSIEATDGHKAIVIPPQFEASDCPKPYKKTRGDVFVPRDVLSEMLRRTKGKGNRAGETTWYGVEAVIKGKGKAEGQVGGAFFSWGMAVERMEFQHEAKFPDLHRVTCDLGEPVLTVGVGSEAWGSMLQAMKHWIDNHGAGGATIEFYGPDKPAIFRAGGVFGAIMPYRADAEPGEYEKDFRGLTDQPEKPSQDEPEASPDQQEPEAVKEPDPAPQPVEVEPVEARDPEGETYLATVQFSDIYDVSEDGREFSEDDGFFRRDEPMTAEEVVEEIKVGGFATLENKVLSATFYMTHYGEEDMYGHTLTKYLTLIRDDGTVVSGEEWKWFMDQAGVSLGGWVKAA